MKNKFKLFVVLSLFGFLLLVLGGCYTQLRTTREAYDDNNKYISEEQNEEATYNNEDEEYSETSGCCEDYRPRVGFVYYYPAYYWPSVAFGIAYTDPWFYDYYWRTYNPWYYYPTYWYPDYWYAPYYYYPYVGYYYSWGDINRSRRYDGSIRGGAIRGGTDYIEQTSTTPTRFDLPGGSSVGKGGSGKNSDRNSTMVRESSRRVQDNRNSIRSEDKSSVRTSNPSIRSSGTRDVSKRNDTRVRNTPPKSQSPEPRGVTPPANTNPPRDSHSNTPSYTPPPPPHSNSTPPSSSGGGSQRSGGDSRGGSNNGPRRP